MDSSELYCPILGVPMWDAVRTLNGRIYSERGILQHLRSRPDAVDPLTRGPITVEELQPAIAVRLAASALIPTQTGWSPILPVDELQFYSDIDLAGLAQQISQINFLQLKHALQYNRGGDFPLLHHICRANCRSLLLALVNDPHLLTHPAMNRSRLVKLGTGPARPAVGFLPTRRVDVRIREMLDADTYESTLLKKPVSELLLMGDYDSVEDTIALFPERAQATLELLAQCKTGRAYAIWLRVGVGDCPSDIFFAPDPIEGILRLTPSSSAILITELATRRTPETAWDLIRRVDQTYIHDVSGSLLHVLSEAHLDVGWDWFNDRRIQVPHGAVNGVGATFVELWPDHFLSSSYFRRLFRELPAIFWKTAPDQDVQDEALFRQCFIKVFFYALQRTTLKFAVFLDKITEIPNRELLFEHCKNSGDLILLADYEFRGEKITEYLERRYGSNCSLLRIKKY